MTLASLKRRQISLLRTSFKRALKRAKANNGPPGKKLQWKCKQTKPKLRNYPLIIHSKLG